MLSLLSLQCNCVMIQMASAEERHKKALNELECQRHNADSARMSLDQKLKDLEKSHKADLSAQTDTVRDMEKHLEETKAKMTMDLKKVLYI